MLAHEDHRRADLLEQAREFHPRGDRPLIDSFLFEGTGFNELSFAVVHWSRIGVTYNDNLPALRASCVFCFSLEFKQA